MSDFASRVEMAEGRAIQRLHILQHSLGLDQFGQGDQYRNRFVTGEGSDDYGDCMDLVAGGLMVRRDGRRLPFGEMDLFHVTDAGKAFVAEHSPHPPKITSSQKRYQAWLDGPADWMSFGDFLRTLPQSKGTGA